MCAEPTCNSTKARPDQQIIVGSIRNHVGNRAPIRLPTLRKFSVVAALLNILDSRNPRPSPRPVALAAATLVSAVDPQSDIHLLVMLVAIPNLVTNRRSAPHSAVQNVSAVAGILKNLDSRPPRPSPRPVALAAATLVKCQQNSCDIKFTEFFGRQNFALELLPHM